MHCCERQDPLAALLMLSCELTFHAIKGSVVSWIEHPRMCFFTCDPLKADQVCTSCKALSYFDELLECGVDSAASVIGDAAPYHNSVAKPASLMFISPMMLCLSLL